MAEERRGEARGASALPVRMINGITGVGGVLGALLVLVVLAITALNVFTRYVLDRPVAGADEATGYLIVAIVMLGAAETLRRGEHIRIDLLLGALGARARWWIELLSFAAVLAFALLLLKSAWRTVFFSYQFGAYSTGELALPLWIPQSTILLGAMLIALAAVAGLLRAIAERPA
jgi:TRAP-type mannitol/chloroaromatic compound transport system permease small subunit